MDSNDLKDAAVEALNLLSVGVVLIQGDGQVLNANRMAQRILERCDGLSCGGGRLQASYSHEQVALTRAIAAAVADLPAGSALTFARPSGRRALSAVVKVLRPEMAGGGRPGLTAVFVTDPDQEVAAEAQTLSSLYGLTPAEARLASSLVRGMSLAQAADALGLTISTVRTQLKRIFSKTETRRQSDLVRVLLTGPAPLRAA